MNHLVRISLPVHLRTLARVNGDVELEVAPPVTQRAVLDVLEMRHPELRGAIREHGTLKRRAFIRFFACQQDISHESPDTPLPDTIVNGAEPFIVLVRSLGDKRHASTPPRPSGRGGMATN